MTRTYFAFIPLVFLVQAAIGQEPKADWRDHIIPVEARSFDFKTVPKGAISVHQFVLQNPFQEPIHIGAITSSCICTTIDFDETKSVLQTYETVDVTVRLRGDMFDGPRNSTITVTLDQPSRTEIQLHIRGEIRSDLNISPTFIDFRDVELGKGASRPLIITYTGSNTQWRLVDGSCENKFIRAEITNAPALVGRKEFRVSVSLDKNAPNGTINSHLILISNDALDRQEIPIPVRATVGTVIRVTPSATSLGILSPGERSPIKDAVLRGTKPFRIVKIESDNPAVEVTPKNSLDTQSLIHLLSVSYRNPTVGGGAPENGTMRSVVKVTTDIPGLIPTFFVTATVQGKGGEQDWETQRARDASHPVTP